MGISEHLVRALFGGQIAGGVGLLLTLIGAVVTARSVRIDRVMSGKLAAARFSSDDDAENAELPLAASLRRQAESASKGLWFIAFGTVLQMVALLQSLFPAP